MRISTQKSATQLLGNKFLNHANIFANIANTFAILRTFAKSCKHLASPVDSSQQQNKNLSKLRDWGTSLKNEEKQGNKGISQTFLLTLSKRTFLFSHS